jgi:hypothetical protein
MAERLSAWCRCGAFPGRCFNAGRGPERAVEQHVRPEGDGEHEYAHADGEDDQARDPTKLAVRGCVVHGADAAARVPARSENG